MNETEYEKRKQDFTLHLSFIFPLLYFFFYVIFFKEGSDFFCCIELMKNINSIVKLQLGRKKKGS